MASRRRPSPEAGARCRRAGRRPSLDPAAQPVGQSDEVGDEGRRRRAVELGGSGELLEPADRHHADPVGDRQGLLLVVGDEQGRRADLELDAADLVAQLARAPWRRGPTAARRAAARCGSMARARARATRCCWPPEIWWAYRSACVGEPDEIQHLAGAALAGGLVAAAQLEPELHVLAGGHVREQAVGLEHHPHVALVGGHAGEVLTADLDRCPRRGPRDRRGNAAPWSCRSPDGPEQGDQLTGREVQGEAVERTHAADTRGADR